MKLEGTFFTYLCVVTVNFPVCGVFYTSGVLIQKYEYYKLILHVVQFDILYIKTAINDVQYYKRFIELLFFLIY